MYNSSRSNDNNGRARICNACQMKTTNNNFHLLTRNNNWLRFGYKMNETNQQTYKAPMNPNPRKHKQIAEKIVTIVDVMSNFFFLKTSYQCYNKVFHDGNE